MNTENDGISDTTPEDNSVAGSVAIDAVVTRWTDAELSISYTLTNNGAFELIVFDVGFSFSTDLVENEQVRLSKAKHDTKGAAYESAPTIEGRNLSPGQTISGSGTERIPINIDFITRPQDGGLTPERVELCIGYGNADDIIPTMTPAGTYSLNQDLELQELVCTMLTKE